MPALLTSTCSRSWLAANSLTRLRIDCCDDRSATRSSTSPLPDRSCTSRLAASPLPLSRQTITTVAPIPARANTFSFPIPAFAPVTITTRPLIPPATLHSPRSLPVKYHYSTTMVEDMLACDGYARQNNGLEIRSLAARRRGGRPLVPGAGPAGGSLHGARRSAPALRGAGQGSHQ